MVGRQAELGGVAVDPRLHLAVALRGAVAERGDERLALRGVQRVADLLRRRLDRRLHLRDGGEDLIRERLEARPVDLPARTSAATSAASFACASRTGALCSWKLRLNGLEGGAWSGRRLNARAPLRNAPK